MTLRRNRSTRGLWVCTTMPGSTGVVHEAGVPFLPSISTRHSRQEPNGSSESVAHSLGTGIPASAAARMTDVPAGTVTVTPSMSTDTICSDVEAGVPWSGSLRRVISSPLRSPIDGSPHRSAPPHCAPEAG